MSGFIYNEETRIHTLDGKIIPSVSNIVAPISLDYSKAHPGKLERKRDLGNAFHECIQLFLNNDLDEDSIDEDLIIPMRQFDEFWETERQLNAIYDWKLRKYDPVCDPLRMAGYDGLAREIIPTGRIIEQAFCNEKLKYCGKPDLILGVSPRKLIVVEFSLDGGYRVHDAEKKQADLIFREMLKNYWMKQKRQKEDKEFENLLENWRKSIQ